MSNIHVNTIVNGDEVGFLCDPRETLLDCLRDKLSLTGAKEGCGTGDCGSCSVKLDGRLVCSCLVLGAEAEGKKIETIEGMSRDEKLHPLQEKYKFSSKDKTVSRCLQLIDKFQNAIRQKPDSTFYSDCIKLCCSV